MKQCPFDQLKEVAWPRELNNDEKLLKRGVRVQYSEKKNKRSREDVMEFHTVLGVVWDDEEQMYFVNTWKLEGWSGKAKKHERSDALRIYN